MMRLARRGCLLALGTAGISGFAVYLNSYGVQAVGDSTVYTTAKNTVAAVVLLSVVGVLGGSREVLRRPSTTGQQWLLAAVGVIGGSVPFVLFFGVVSLSEITGW